jgi:hypothetical protein
MKKIIILSLGLLLMSISFLLSFWYFFPLCRELSCSLEEKNNYSLWTTRYGNVLFLSGKISDNDMYSISERLGFGRQKIEILFLQKNSADLVKSATNILFLFPVIQIVLPEMPKSKNISKSYYWMKSELERFGGKIITIPLDTEYIQEYIGMCMNVKGVCKL